MTCSTIFLPSNFPSEFSYGKRHNIDLEITQQVAPSIFEQSSNFSKSLIMWIRPNKSYGFTSHIPYIHQNFPFALQSYRNQYNYRTITMQGKSSHNHSHQPQQHIFLDMNSSCVVKRFHLREMAGQGEIKSGGVEDHLPRTSSDDNSIKMLPLTEVKENC